MRIGTVEIDGRVYVDAKDVAELIDRGEKKFPHKKQEILGSLKMWLNLVKPNKNSTLTVGEKR